MKFGLDSVDGLVITGGRFNDNDEWAIRVSRGSGYAIDNAVFKNNGNNTAGTGHALFENDASHCIIKGIFKATAYRGVQVGGTAGNILIDGVFNGITQDDIYTSSSNENITIRGVSDTNRTIASTAALPIPMFGDEFTITGTTSITSILDTGTRSEGRIVTLRFNSTLTFTDGGNLVLAGNFSTSANDTITLRCMNGAWLELSRSVN